MNYAEIWQGNQLNGVVWLSVFFYIIALLLPAVYTTNETHNHLGFTCLLFGPFSLFSAGNTDVLKTFFLWFLNIPYFLLIVSILQKRPSMTFGISIILLVILIFTLSFAPSAKLLKDTAGNLQSFSFMKGAHLWLFSMTILSVAGVIQYFNLNLSTLFILITFFLGLIILYQGILQIIDSYNTDLKIRTEFRDPQIIKALEEWKSNGPNKRTLLKELGPKCTQTGRFGLSPLAYLLLKNAPEAFGLCLSVTTQNATIPDKYARKSRLWRKNIITSAMHIVWGREQTLALLENYFFPHITSKENFYRDAGYSHLWAEIISDVIRSENFKTLFRPSQGPIHPMAFKFYKHLNDFDNQTYISNLIWLTKVSPDSYTRLGVGEKIINDLKEVSSENLDKLKNEIIKLISHKP